MCCIEGLLWFQSHLPIYDVKEVMAYKQERMFMLMRQISDLLHMRHLHTAKIQDYFYYFIYFVFFRVQENVPLFYKPVSLPISSAIVQELVIILIIVNMTIPTILLLHLLLVM